VKETPTARYTYLSYTVLTTLPYDQIVRPYFGHDNTISDTCMCVWAVQLVDEM
jgi:hypothetical protein